jgi:hypothetical protein
MLSCWRLLCLVEDVADAAGALVGVSGIVLHVQMDGWSWNVHDCWCDVIWRNCATLEPAGRAMLAPLWQSSDLSITKCACSFGAGEG